MQVAGDYNVYFMCQKQPITEYFSVNYTIIRKKEKKKKGKRRPALFG